LKTNHLATLNESTFGVDGGNVTPIKISNSKF
jgi:hypothetical protein